ncbi:hypothetical protein SGFS_100570 [Streptomyces graminofaciens]|uniref:Uncharacterized protein n=1 Tax=Streptomyces graminofaciens TaxID=68212 RepID=A0ABN5VZR4_9ACTN|nr:hypothetical protein SGFS_100570 [Streptomyces graminofaciens]
MRDVVSPEGGLRLRRGAGGQGREPTGKAALRRCVIGSDEVFSWRLAGQCAVSRPAVHTACVRRSNIGCINGYRSSVRLEPWQKYPGSTQINMGIEAGMHVER